MSTDHSPSLNLASGPSDSESADHRHASLSREAWLDQLNAEVDPDSELVAVTSALLALRLDPFAPDAPMSGLLSLHGALLLFQLGGRAELLPPVGLFVFGRRILERRIVASARRLARRSPSADDSYDSWVRSAQRIEELIGLIDPELRDSVAV